ncbi:type II toxin-antitoxin system YoeB family toxin [Parablautia intestinalis]|nr:type II toxin-antitoxin system YoeB family toxin [Parablautia intestinalis]
MGVFWVDEAWQEYIDWQEQDKKTLRKINQHWMKNQFVGRREIT